MPEPGQLDTASSGDRCAHPEGQEHSPRKGKWGHRASAGFLGLLSGWEDHRVSAKGEKQRLPSCTQSRYSPRGHSPCKLYTKWCLYTWGHLPSERYGALIRCSVHAGLAERSKASPFHDCELTPTQSFLWHLTSKIS